MRILVELRNIMRILNVAEKNDAAKNIAAQLSNGSSRMRDGISKFNKIYEFELNLFNRKCQMIMTSVSGHLLSLEFLNQYQKWSSCQPVELFSAQVEKKCPEDFISIKKTLEREIRTCEKLIIWTDCDREGENIGYEIIDVCKAVRPNIDIYRAIFSEITRSSMQRAINSLTRPNKLISDAVDARMELDLRIGASFTRFQTMRLQKRFPNALEKNVISYGSCQFPTLGFVVERFKQREQFISEPFWKIVVNRVHDGKNVEFSWERVRSFDYQVCLSFYELMLLEPMATIISVNTKPKSKWRPVALDTVELEKSASRKLKINAKETMHIAEKLYTQGFISYPRTETNIFPKDFNLAELIDKQTNDNSWGEFAKNVNESGPNPRNGNKTDQAHPPIHPTKYTNSLTGNDRKVYEFIVRHFLACCSKDARGSETTATIEINKEIFSANGLMIIEKNYLEVYPYEKWSDKEMPHFKEGDRFQPDSIELKESRTEAPKLLTEADLIALMEKHGIGTDATHAEHIEKIKEREYASINPQNFFIPLELGLGLVDGYDSMGYEMSKPNLRRILEEDLKAICDGRKTKQEVLEAQISAYRNCFEDACRNVEKLDEALGKYFGRASTIIPDERDNWAGVPIFECGCKSQMVLKAQKSGKYVIGCRAFPTCKTTIWLPSSVKEACATDEFCQKCAPKKIKKIKFILERGAVLSSYPTNYTTCIICDNEFRHHMEIDISQYTTSLNRSNLTPTGTTQYNPSSTPRVNSSSSINTVRNHHTSAVVTNKTFNRSNDSSNFVSPSNNVFNNSNNNKRSQQLSNSVNNTSNNDNDDDSNPTVCNCGLPALKLVVKKEGPNKGREFYTCGDNKACDFFMWKDGLNISAGGSSGGGGGGYGGSGRTNNYNDRSVTNYNQGQSSATSNSGDVMCNCNEPSKKLTVQKEGPNKGRNFFACSTKACNFFAWEDNVTNGKSSKTFESGTKKKSPNKKDNALNGTKTKTPRKCSQCGEEGHNKKNCPN